MLFSDLDDAAIMYIELCSKSMVLIVCILGICICVSYIHILILFSEIFLYSDIAENHRNPAGDRGPAAIVGENRSLQCLTHTTDRYVYLPHIHICKHNTQTSYRNTIVLHNYNVYLNTITIHIEYTYRVTYEGTHEDTQIEIHIEIHIKVHI